MALVLDDPRFPPLTTSSQLACVHGGAVTGIPSGSERGSSGAPILKPTDAFLVSGCPFQSPCVRVQWVVSASSDRLDARSTGLSLSAQGIPQGPVLIIRA